MKKIILLLVIILSTLDASAQRVFVRNLYEEPLWVAIGYRHKVGNWCGYYAQGWFKIIPGQKALLTTLELEARETIYIYAHDEDHLFEIRGDEDAGAIPMYIPTSKFNIKNFSSDYVKKQNPEYMTVYPRKYHVRRDFYFWSPTNYRDVTIDLRDRDGVLDTVRALEDLIVE